jgi:hypothetical protein
LKFLDNIFTEGGKNKDDITQRIKEAKVMFNNKKQLLCSNILSLEMKNKEDITQRIKEAKVMFNNKKQLLFRISLVWKRKKERIKSCIWSVAVYGSETWTVGRSEEGVVNVLKRGAGEEC